MKFLIPEVIGKKIVHAWQNEHTRCGELPELFFYSINEFICHRVGILELTGTSAESIIRCAFDEILPELKIIGKMPTEYMLELLVGDTMTAMTN